MMRWIALLLLVPALALAAACGGGDDDDGGAEPAGDATGPAATEDGGTAGEGAPVLTMETTELGVGDASPVELQITDFPPPGMGAWTVDVAYDPAVVSVGDCAVYEGSVCNPAYSESTVRIAGAVAVGLEGDTVLATITFTCDVAGSSPLNIGVDVLADATIGDPQPVEATLEDGELTCAE